MSSATSYNRADNQETDTESARWKVVFWASLLFLLFQAALYFSSDSPGRPSRFELTELPGKGLRLLSLDGNETLKPLAAGPAGENSPSFAHFYFKPIPINSGSKELLMSVKGIGPSLADEIIRTREEIGAFKSPEDLLLVRGIGNKRLHSFAKQFEFSDNGKSN